MNNYSNETRFFFASLGEIILEQYGNDEEAAKRALPFIAMLLKNEGKGD